MRRPGLKTLLPLLTILIGAIGVAVAVRPFAAEETQWTLNLAQMRRSLADLPKEDLSQPERDGAMTLREGVKLSHDLYAAFANAWALPVFTSAAFNAQSHTDAVGLVLERYGLRDPVAGMREGEFASARLRDLFSEMRQQGSESELAALLKSAELEELGIIYLKNLLAGTDNQDLTVVYTELLRGAALNLQDFVVASRSAGGGRYEPKHLTRAELNEALLNSPNELEEGNSLLLRATDYGRCGIDDVQRLTRRRARPRDPRVPAAVARQREYCSTDVAIAGSQTRTIKIGSKNVTLSILPTGLAQMPAPVDSNSPAYWQDNTLSLFNSWDDVTFRSTGDGVENLDNPVQIQLPRPQRPGNVWLEATWRDAQTGVLYGWYHFEPSDLPCAPLTSPLIGAAVSRDGGITWEDRGFVLDAAYEPDCSYRNGYFVGGHGDFSVILGARRQYFYFLFSNYAGPPEEQGVGVARSSMADRGQPRTATKYYNGAWAEPGLGGRVTPVIGVGASWQGPYVDAFWGPSVHWNSAIESYVALLNHTADGSETWQQEGIYVTFSNDLLTWSAPEKIIETNNWYPQILGLDRMGTDSMAQRYMRVYVGGVSRIILELRATGGN